MNGLRRPNLPGANCSTKVGNIPLESPGWTASWQTLLMPEITQPHTGRFDALFSSSLVQGRTSRRGDHTERLLTFPKRRVVWLHDTIGGFPSNVSFPSPSPPPPTISSWRRPPALYQLMLRTAYSEAKCLRIQEVRQHRNSPLGPDPSNPPAKDMMPFHGRTAV